jgi:S-formylglutathione hydrolase FrmB
VAAGALGAAAALAGGAGLVQAGVLPGRYRVGRLLGACDVGDLRATGGAPGPLRFASFPSERRGRPVGWSMGGAGALRLAETHPERLAAVVAASPAIAATGSEVAGAGRLTGLPVKVDCGANDPFAPGTRALAATLPVAEVTVTKGCHDGRFWQHQTPAQLRFLAGALASG